MKPNMKVFDSMKRSFIFVIAALMLAAAPASAAVVESSNVEFSIRKPKKEKKTVVFDSDIHCKSCAKKIEENISFEKGVLDLKVSVEDKTITVTYDAAKTSEKTLIAAINKLGYSVKPRAEK